MIDKLRDLVLANLDKIIPLVAGGVITLFFTKILPVAWQGARRFVTWVGGRIGGRVSYRFFQQQYLDWLVTDLQELRLTGIVSAEDSKRPKLEQVYLSLRLESATEPHSSPTAGTSISRSGRGVSTWKDAAELLQIYNDCHSQNARTPPHEVLERSLTQAQSLARKQTKTLGVVSRRVDSFRRLARRRDVDTRQQEESLVLQWLREHNSVLEAALGDFQLRRALQRLERIAILGGPGAGKTTLLQHIALTFARERAGDPKLRRKGNLRRILGATSWRVPIFIRLSSIAGQLATRSASGLDPSILDVLTTTLPPDLQSVPEAKNYFAAQLKKGGCIVLLDGLDEVPSDHEFVAVTRAIQSMVVRYPGNLYVVTSRVAGWRTGVGADFAVSYVEDLSDGQIETFVDTWYAAVERNAVPGRLEDESPSERKARERRAAQNSSNLKNALQTNQGIRRLATNPMLLSIIAVVHRSLATLPRERSKLYNQCSQILLEQWDISRGLRVDDTGLRLEQKQLIMRRLAYALHTGEIGDKGGGREADMKQFEKVIAGLLPGLGKSPESAPHLLRRLLERSGLLIERSRGSVSFAHHTFQEYFTAQCLADQGVETGTAFLVHPDRLLSDWWREVALLFSGLLPDSSVFIQSVDRGSDEDVFQQRTRMAALCASESVTIREENVRGSVVRQALAVRQVNEKPAVPLTDAVGDYVLRWAKSSEWLQCAALLSQAVSPKTFRAQFQILVESKSLSADMRYALLRCARSGKPIEFDSSMLKFLADALKGDSLKSKKLAIEALGRAGADESVGDRIDTLASVLTKPEVQLVRAAAEAIGRLLVTAVPTADLVATLKELLVKNPSRASLVLRILVRNAKAKASELLVVLFDRASIQSLSELAMSRAGGHSAAGAIQALALVPKASGRREEILALILSRLDYVDEHVHGAACQSIAQLAQEGNAQQVIAALIGALQSGTSPQRAEHYLEAIAQLAPKNASSSQWRVLERYMQTGATKTRALAILAAQALRPPSASSGMLTLHSLLKERAVEVRAASLKALTQIGKVNDREVESVALELLRSRSVDNRIVAAEALLQFSSVAGELRLCDAVRSALRQEIGNIPWLVFSRLPLIGRMFGRFDRRLTVCRLLVETLFVCVARLKSTSEFREFFNLCCEHVWLVAGVSRRASGEVVEEEPVLPSGTEETVADSDLPLYPMPAQLQQLNSINSIFEILSWGMAEVLIWDNAKSESAFLRKLRGVVAELPSDFVLELCREALSRDNPFARLMPVSVLSVLPYERGSLANELLKKALVDRDKRVELAACFAAGRYAQGTKDAVLFGALQERLNEAEPVVQGAAWEAISLIFSSERPGRGRA